MNRGSIVILFYFDIISLKMTEYNSANLELFHSQLGKLKSIIKVLLKAVKLKSR